MQAFQYIWTTNLKKGASLVPGTWGIVSFLVYSPLFFIKRQRALVFRSSCHLSLVLVHPLLRPFLLSSFVLNSLQAVGWVGHRCGRWLVDKVALFHYDSSVRYVGGSGRTLTRTEVKAREGCSSFDCWVPSFLIFFLAPNEQTDGRMTYRWSSFLFIQDTRISQSCSNTQEYSSSMIVRRRLLKPLPPPVYNWSVERIANISPLQPAPSTLTRGTRSKKNSL